MVITNLKGEIWREVIGYEGYYDISNMGRLRTYWVHTNGERYLSKEPQRIIKGRTKKQKRNYNVQTLYTEYKDKCHIKTSRIVAQAFLGLDISDKNQQVIFKDMNGLNNKVENLFIGGASKRAFHSINLKKKNSFNI